MKRLIVLLGLAALIAGCSSDRVESQGGYGSQGTYDTGSDTTTGSGTDLNKEGTSGSTGTGNDTARDIQNGHPGMNTTPGSSSTSTNVLQTPPDKGGTEPETGTDTGVGDQSDDLDANDMNGTQDDVNNEPVR